LKNGWQPVALPHIITSVLTAREEGQIPLSGAEGGRDCWIILEEFKMSEKQESSAKGTLSSDALDAKDVLEGAEPWEPIETKLVVWSFVAAAVALLLGLLLVPTSILH
jgi:hypothetical protein